MASLASTSVLRQIVNAASEATAGSVASCRYCQRQALRASLHTSSRVQAQFLTADKVERNGDPFDIDNLQKFNYDDVTWNTHQKLDDDRDRIKLMRLIAFQMPEIAS